MDELILKALDHLPVATVTRAEWVSVGMALKEEGYPVTIWDDWSKADSRYKPGEPERLWNGFNGNAKPVKAGTIVDLAKKYGWKPQAFEGNGIMDWNDTIEYDGDDIASYVTTPARKPTEELALYIKTLFKPDEHVSYVVEAFQDEKDHKWKPAGKGVSFQTAGELLKSLEKHPDDIGATIGDYNEAAGVWIRFNPLDGTGGAKNANVTRWKYALVESDDLSIQEQNFLYKKLELPIELLVNSGGKSLHAIVKVDADGPEEYSKRVSYLYEYLEAHGCAIDKQNSNCSRLSRMPGVKRGEGRQYIVETNIGRASWADWVDFTEGEADDLPEIVTLSQFKDPPKLPDELIKGILRCGHKMLISGSSKAGKSFLLIELAAAIAEGKDWLGFECKQGKVLYVNLEIDNASCINRFWQIYSAKGLDIEHAANLDIWNLRGHSLTLDKLVPKIVRRSEGKGYSAIIIDPIYKVITGDENNASEMGRFCNFFDEICRKTGCACIYCHHHSKGAQGSKRAMDRASGSGVFARDPDAQLDMIQLDLTNDLKNNVADSGSTAWRLESSLREFENIKPVNFWFNYPIHELDKNGELANVHAEGSALANLQHSKNRQGTPESKAQDFTNAFYANKNNLPAVPLIDIAHYLGKDQRTVRSWMKYCEGQFVEQNGVVIEAES